MDETKNQQPAQKNPPATHPRDRHIDTHVPADPKDAANMRELLHATGLDAEAPFDEGFSRSPDAPGVEGADHTSFPIADGETGQTTSSDYGGIYAEGSAVTAEGDLAIDGGHLPGNQDTFEGELQSEVTAEPGAGDRANEGLGKDENR